MLRASVQLASGEKSEVTGTYLEECDAVVTPEGERYGNPPLPPVLAWRALDCAGRGKQR